MEVKDLGLIDYQKAWDLQKQCVDEIVKGRKRGYLLLCEHPTVLTLGRLADRSHILFSKDILARQKVSVVPIDRGGEVTVHAPGQLVVYPILDLEKHGKDLHSYLHKLEQVGIDFLRLFDIMGDRMPEKTGVWVDSRKIMSVGIGVRRWISFHGISVNINTDLSLFGLIRPCGMEVEMTSIGQEKGCKVDMAAAKEKIVSIFQREFAS